MYERAAIASGLQALTRLVIQLLLIRSGELAHRCRSTRLRLYLRGRDLKRRHYIRSLLGARLRRVLQSKDVASRIDSLIRVLRRLDDFARLLSKRRLMRLWGLKPAPTPAVVVSAAPGRALAFVDSS